MARIAKLAGFVVLVTVINLVTILAVVNPVRSTAGQDPPCVVGDVNGDFAVNIGDPIYLLSFLFNQGPEPVACAEGPSLTKEEIALLREILPHLSIEQLDDGQGGTARIIRFSEVNVQIVNGLGATNGNAADPESTEGTVNGLGNLITSARQMLARFREASERTRLQR